MSWRGPLYPWEDEPWTPKSGGPRAERIQVWPRHAVFGSSASRLTMSTRSIANSHACAFVCPRERDWNSSALREYPVMTLPVRQTSPGRCFASVQGILKGDNVPRSVSLNAHRSPQHHERQGATTGKLTAGTRSLTHRMRVPGDTLSVRPSIPHIAIVNVPQTHMHFLLFEPAWPVFDVYCMVNLMTRLVVLCWRRWVWYWPRVILHVPSITKKLLSQNNDHSPLFCSSLSELLKWDMIPPPTVMFKRRQRYLITLSMDRVIDYQCVGLIICISNLGITNGDTSIPQMDDWVQLSARASTSMFHPLGDKEEGTRPPVTPLINVYVRLCSDTDPLRNTHTVRFCQVWGWLAWPGSVPV